MLHTWKDKSQVARSWTSKYRRTIKEKDRERGKRGKGGGGKTRRSVMEEPWWGKRRGEEGICVSAGRRDLIRACRVSLGIVGKCLLSQEMVYKRIGPSTLAGQRFTPLFRTELNFCLDLSTSVPLRTLRRRSWTFQRSVRFINRNPSSPVSTQQLENKYGIISSGRIILRLMIRFQEMESFLSPSNSSIIEVNEDFVNGKNLK